MTAKKTMAAAARSQIRLYNRCITGISSDGDVLIDLVQLAYFADPVVMVVPHMFDRRDKREVTVL
jgi:hypothetical protein